ncbi:MAG: methytransferase partner Trm112 [Candidatus Thermoplasmatota archaeon]
MKREIIEILCCPKCKGSLKLTVNEEEEDEIITGSLKCKNCDNSYPIDEGIPNFLPKKK